MATIHNDHRLETQTATAQFDEILVCKCAETSKVWRPDRRLDEHTNGKGHTYVRPPPTPLAVDNICAHGISKHAVNIDRGFYYIAMALYYVQTICSNHVCGTTHQVYGACIVLRGHTPGNG